MTVIIPIFNDAHNIGRCLDSILNQSFKELNIIVVNDASTDNTKDILNFYSKYRQIKIINMIENVGAGVCRNTGIVAAQTPYVTFVDSDDWIDINAYAKCLKETPKEPDIISFGLVYDYVQYNRRFDKYNYPNVYQTNGDFALRIYAHTIPNKIKITPIVNNKLYRKKFLQKNNLYFSPNIRYQEDDIFTFEVLSMAEVVVFVDECKYHYCQRSGSLIHTISELAIDNFVTAYLELKMFLEQNEIFEKYKGEFYLKFKSSLLGVVRRLIDYEPDMNKRNRLLCKLLILLTENYNIYEIINTFDFSIVRRLL